MPSWITDQIAVGGAGITPDTWSDMAAKYHFSAVLSLRGEFQDIFDSPLPSAYLWLPVTDHSDPSPEQLLIGVQFIDAAVRSKQRVLVHCKMGIGRSPTMVAAYLVWSGSSIDEAIQIVAKVADMVIIRPVVSRLTLEKLMASLNRKG